MIEDDMVGWHHQVNGHKFEQAPGDGERQGSLACYSSWSCKELDKTSRLNNNNFSSSILDTFDLGAHLPVSYLFAFSYCSWRSITL